MNKNYPDFEDLMVYNIHLFKKNVNIFVAVASRLKRLLKTGITKIKVS